MIPIVFPHYLVLLVAAATMEKYQKGELLSLLKEASAIANNSANLWMMSKPDIHV